MIHYKTQIVKLLNQSYEIKCPEHEIDNLNLAAAKLNQELQQQRKKFKKLDDFQVLLLAALTISHELINCRQHQEQQFRQVSQLVNSLENNTLYNPSTCPAEQETQTD